MRITQRNQHILTAYFFILPGLLLYLIFIIYPIAKALQMSFYEWSIVPGNPSELVGLANYARALQDPVAKLALRNTIIYTLITVPGQMILALLAALLLNNISRGKTFFRTLYYLPVVTSWVIVSLLFKYIFQSPKGVLNHLLANVLHVVQDPIPWLRNRLGLRNLEGCWVGDGYFLSRPTNNSQGII